MRDFWLERFTVEEIRELVGAIWREPSQTEWRRSTIGATSW
jgi:hypothetical protein